MMVLRQILASQAWESERYRRVYEVLTPSRAIARGSDG